VWGLPPKAQDLNFSLKFKVTKTAKRENASFSSVPYFMRQSHQQAASAPVTLRFVHHSIIL
jgi:hypothetical protein